MKRGVLYSLLALSLAANVALWAFSKSRSGPTQTGAAEGFRAQGKDPVAAGANTIGGTAKAHEATLYSDAWAKLYSEDLATLAERLRKAGLSDKFVRFIINAEIADRFKARREALWPTAVSKDWWREPGNGRMPLKTRLALLDLSREGSRLSEQILGPDPAMDDDGLPISPEKRAEVKLILEDYSAMRSSLAGAILTASQRERMALLDTERRKDLATLLSPEEIERLEISNSPTTGVLNYQYLKGLEVTEAEFKDLYAVMKAMDDKRQAGGAGAADYETYRKNQEEMAKTFETILGEERYKTMLRNADMDSTSLQSMAQRNGVPDATVSEVLALRDSLLKQAQSLRDNDTLTPEQKTNQLKNVAQMTEAQVLAKLGQDMGKSYLSRTRIIESMKQGMVVELSPFGGWSSYPVSMKRRP